jgi:D-amino peptidase
MHIAVFADIEGSFGIWRMRQCRMGTPEWQYGRECLTDDVNAVIAGAFEGGADTVTVKDTHETGFNCLVNRLDKRAWYVGGHYIVPTLFGRVTDYDLVLYVAIHAASGTENAFFPHTHSGVFSKLLVNGKTACEMDIYGGYLGEFNVPIGFVSGEAIAVQQALEVIPWAKFVTVDKQKETYTSGEKSLFYLKEGRRRLRESSMLAVKEAAVMKPKKITGPIHFEAEFRSEDIARKINTWEWPRRGNTVEWQSDNMIDGMEALNKLAFFPKKFYPFRRPMMFLMRRYFGVKHAYFAPKPNREDAAIFSI